jgi:hypothetical protein
LLKCKEENCGGTLDDDKDSIFPLKTGCESYSCATPCLKCGRVHWLSGNPVFRWDDKKLFIENGKMVYK